MSYLRTAIRKRHRHGRAIAAKPAPAVFDVMAKRIIWLKKTRQLNIDRSRLR